MRVVEKWREMEYSGYVRCDGGEVGLFRQLLLPRGCAERSYAVGAGGGDTAGSG